MLLLNNSGNVTIFPNFTLANAGGDSGAAGVAAMATVILLCNGIVLLALIKEKSLRTAFNVYIMVLLSFNMVYVGVHSTMNILTQQFTKWRFSTQICTLDLHAMLVVAPVINHTHVLISVNRFWALFWPVSYRNHHTVVVAWLLCFGTFMYCHLLILPGLIVDQVYYRLPVEKGCYVNRNAQFGWNTFISVWVRDLPKIFIPASYPVLLWKQLKIMRASAVSPSVLKTAASGGSRPLEDGSDGTKNMTASAVPSNKAATTTKEITAQGEGRKRKIRSKPFLLTTLFTIGIVICWMPTLIYYEMTNFIPESKMMTFRKVQVFMYPFQMILDPVFFCLSIGNLHNYLRQIWKALRSERKLRRV